MATLEDTLGDLIISVVLGIVVTTLFVVVITYYIIPFISTDGSSYKYEILFGSNSTFSPH